MRGEAAPTCCRARPRRHTSLPATGTGGVCCGKTPSCGWPGWTRATKSGSGRRAMPARCEPRCDREAVRFGHLEPHLDLDLREVGQRVRLLQNAHFVESRRSGAWQCLPSPIPEGQHGPARCQKWIPFSPKSAICQPPKCGNEASPGTAKLHSFAVTGPAPSIPVDHSQTQSGAQRRRRGAKIFRN